MKKREFAKYLRNHHLNNSEELSNKVGKPKKAYEEMILRTSDQDMIDSYRVCQCGHEFINKKEMDSLIHRYDDSEKTMDEIPTGHE